MEITPSNQSRPLVLLDGSDFCNGRLRQIYCKALISHARSCKRKIAHAILEKGLSLFLKRHVPFFRNAPAFFHEGMSVFSRRCSKIFLQAIHEIYKPAPILLQVCTKSITCMYRERYMPPPLGNPLAEIIENRKLKIKTYSISC